MKKNLTLVFIVSVLVSCSGLKKERVDLLIHNAVVYTLDDSFSTQDAVAVKNGKIVAVGAEHEIMNKYQAVNVVDAKKQFVYPGFIDGHCHFVGYAKSLQSVNLVGTKSWEECIERIVEFVKLHQEGWITGRGWDQNDWENKEMPVNDTLNKLFPDRPVLLRRIDGHGAIANAKALEIAGINSTTQVAGGKIFLLNNQPTGVLVDNAVDLVAKMIPEMDEKALSKALLEAQDKCFSFGLTTLDDAGLSAKEIQLIEKLQSDSLLKMNIYAMVQNDSQDVAYFLNRGVVQTPKLTVRSVKVYADGALGSRGASLKKPYTDDPHNHGLLLTPLNEVKELAHKLNEAGFQMNTHCIGDSANKLLLDIYGAELKDVNDKRWRIEHAQVVDSVDMHKYQQFTIIPSVQPTHATSDMYWAKERLGEKRVKNAYAYKTLLHQNHVLALGTDAPIESIDPLKTFYAAVYRVDESGYPNGGYFINEALTPEEALRGMTIWNALANFEEETKGTIEVNKKANFTILNMDLMKVKQTDFHLVEVKMTIVDGEVVYKSR